MIHRVTAILFLVCQYCAAQTMLDAGELGRRLNLVETERSHGRLAEAESMLTAVQAEIEGTQGPGLLLAAALRERGLLRDDEERSDEAIPLYERALAMFRAEPRAGTVTIGLLLANLASAHTECGDFDQGLSLSTEAVNLLRTAATARREFAVSLYAHGSALYHLGRNEEALRDLRESLDIWRRVEAPDDLQLALVTEEIGKCLFDLGYVAKAEASEREALEIRAKAVGPDSLSVAASLNNLGVMLVRDERFTEARQSFERAELIFEHLGENEQRRLTTLLGNLGTLYYSQDRDSAQFYAKAEDVYRRKLAIEERLFGSSDVRESSTLEMLGEILYRERAYSEAGRIYGRGLAIQQAAFGPADPKTQAAAKRYSVLLKKVKMDATK